MKSRKYISTTICEYLNKHKLFEDYKNYEFAYTCVAPSNSSSLEGMSNLIKGVFDCSINRLKTFNSSGVTNGKNYIFNNIISVLIHILIDKENRKNTLKTKG